MNNVKAVKDDEVRLKRCDEKYSQLDLMHRFILQKLEVKDIFLKMPYNSFQCSESQYLLITYTKGASVYQYKLESLNFIFEKKIMLSRTCIIHSYTFLFVNVLQTLNKNKEKD